MTITGWTTSASRLEKPFCLTAIRPGFNPGDQAGDARAPGCELFLERLAVRGWGVPARI